MHRQLSTVVKIIYASDSSLLAVFGSEISPAIHAKVVALFHALEEEGDPAIRNLHPAYSSLLVIFDPLRTTHQLLAARIRQIVDSTELPVDKTRGRLISVPVCYDTEFGLDLDGVAAFSDISPGEVIRLHSAAEYRVYFLGFTPGFAYMGGLPDKLHVPRLSSPRVHVAAGSVGIAGSQTGIYPMDSPGGWQLLGRTPWCMFDPRGTPPSRLQPGDLVKFVAIDRAQFDSLRRLATSD